MENILGVQDFTPGPQFSEAKGSILADLELLAGALAQGDQKHAMEVMTRSMVKLVGWVDVAARDAAVWQMVYRIGVGEEDLEKLILAVEAVDGKLEELAGKLQDVRAELAKADDADFASVHAMISDPKILDPGSIREQLAGLADDLMSLRAEENADEDEDDLGDPGDMGDPDDLDALPDVQR